MPQDKAYFLMQCAMNGTPLSEESLRKIVMEWWWLRSRANGLPQMPSPPRQK